MDINPQILCWNVRGLNCPAKRAAVREFVQAAKVNLVCLQETKLDVLDQFVVLQCLGPSFDGFDYLPACETRGWILIAWDRSVMDVDALVHDTNSLSDLVHNKDGTNWWITAVYGPQGDELKTAFLEELRARRLVCQGPWMVLGDFNMILHASEKNNVNLNRRMMQRFRGFVDSHELKELYMHGRIFT